jgi:hypothetical protein
MELYPYRDAVSPSNAQAGHIPTLDLFRTLIYKIVTTEHPTCSDTTTGDVVSSHDDIRHRYSLANIRTIAVDDEKHSETGRHSKRLDHSASILGKPGHGLQGRFSRQKQPEKVSPDRSVGRRACVAGLGRCS